MSNPCIEFAKWLRVKEWQDGEIKTLYIKADYDRIYELYVESLYSPYINYCNHYLRGFKLASKAVD